ncbi:C40 family peptidase [Flavobacterium sp. LB2P44]|uniref:C40 family peptidase n=1 Tax=Flavobacterium sp. LB2P44 TaxID=3401713 RepID=UPI003AB0E6F7
MTSKKKYRVRFIRNMGLLALVFCSVAYGSSRTDTFLLQKNEIVIKNELIYPIETNISLGEKIVNFGMGLLGTPYVAAGCSKNGFDCSGFVYFVFNHFKIQVPRSSSEFKNFGKEIPIANVKKGDLLLFLSPTRNVIGHIGIVSNPNGMDSDFIHSSSGREMKVIITNLKKPGYTRRFVKAIRVL